MLIRDKNLKAAVAVRDRDCLALPCYRPRRDPGILIPGIGYRERAGGNGGYECGWREVHGCPNRPPQGEPPPVRTGKEEQPGPGWREDPTPPGATAPASSPPSLYTVPGAL